MTFRKWSWFVVSVGLGWYSHSARGQEVLKGRVVLDPVVTPILDQNSNVYHVAHCATRPVIDGNAGEWKDVPAMSLDKKEQSYDRWEGPRDLSGSMRIQWDAAGLYFCLQVVDDAHHAPFLNTSWWENDSSQFVFDPLLNGPKGGFGREALNYVVCDSPQGPLMATYRTPGTGRESEVWLKDRVVKMTVQPDGVRVYEWAMTWSQLERVAPWLLGRCGFNWTVNDNDGNRFKSALFWTRGVIHGQDASQFGQLVFDGAQGRQPAILGLCPETKLHENTAGRSLTIAGMEPFGVGRLLVSTPTARKVEAIATVYRAGEDKPVARGSLQLALQAHQTAALAWDVSGLPDGPYEIVYEVPALSTVPSDRLAFHQLNVARLPKQQEALRERYGLDRPWDAMADAPALIRRHRGMVAVALAALQSDAWTTGLRDTDVTDRHLDMLVNVSAMVNALEAGQDFLGAQRGDFWSAYYSRADGSGQLFVVMLPADFDSTKRYPLVVRLHGNGGMPFPRPKVAGAAEAGSSCIEVSPWGRGNNSYRALGESDVLSIMRYMQEWYRIDPSRIYLAGASMGGSGTWRLACRYPDLFAAVAPVCGSNFGLPLENLRQVPVLNHHGAQDWIVPIDTDRYGVSRLQQLGYSILHNELPTAGHRIMATYPARDWLLTHQRPERPAGVTVACQTPEEGRAYGVMMLEFVEPHARARVKSQVTGYGPQQSLTLALENVGVLGLEIERMPLAREADLLIQADYEFLQVKAPLPATLYLTRKDGHWSTLPTWTAPATSQREYRPGAAANLYEADEPLLVVYGTRGTPERVKVLRDAATKLTRWPGAGPPMPFGRFALKADADVTADDLNRYNLIVIGGTADSELTTRILSKLPLQVNEKDELIAGAREPLSLAEAGVRLFFYNPLAPARLLFWIAPGANTEATTKWLKQPERLMTGADGNGRNFQADLIVQTMAEGELRRCMQFTRDWQWRELGEGVAANRLAPEAMSGHRQFQQAYLRAMRRAVNCDFALQWAPAEPGRLYDPRTFSRADLAVLVEPEEVLCGSVTGQELLEIQEKCVAKGKIEVLPAIEPKAINPNQSYRLALPPSLSWALKVREKNLRDMEAGPEIREQDILAEVFKE